MNEFINFYVNLMRNIECIIQAKAKSFLKHTIRKVQFLSKKSILTKPQRFHEFFTQIFFDKFSREIKVVNR